MKPLKLIVLLIIQTTPSFIISQQKVGINISDPAVSLEVSGRIQINEESATPEAGQIRWNNSTSDFEGYNGSAWVSFTNGTSGQTQGSTGPNTMQDIDGNEYPTVVIGTQEWMAENLRTTRYNDGIPIPHVPKPAIWKQLDNLQQNARSWSEHAEENTYPYGALYNSYAITSGKLCPTGWHVPNQAEWNTLITFLGTEPGGQLKQSGNTSEGTGLFNSPNIGANNSSGFSAIPAGLIGSSGAASSLGSIALFASSTEETGELISFWLTNESSGIATSAFPLDNGFSVRCLKD